MSTLETIDSVRGFARLTWGIPFVSFLFVTTDPVPDVEMFLIVFWDLLSLVRPEISVPVVDSFDFSMFEILYGKIWCVEIVKNTIVTNPVNRKILCM